MDLTLGGKVNGVRQRNPEFDRASYEAGVLNEAKNRLSNLGQVITHLHTQLVERNIPTDISVTKTERGYVRRVPFGTKKWDVVRHEVLGAGWTLHQYGESWSDQPADSKQPGNFGMNDIGVVLLESGQTVTCINKELGEAFEPGVFPLPKGITYDKDSIISRSAAANMGLGNVELAGQINAVNRFEDSVAEFIVRNKL